MKAILLSFLILFSTSSLAQSFEKKVLQIDPEIQGDLYIGAPNSKTVIVIIAGSGPTDRNGNQPPMSMNNSLKFLAEGLASNGYNVFTFDKRVIAQIKNKHLPEGITFENSVDDVVLITNNLREQFVNIIIAGHSEGALVGTLAAQKTSAKAFIFLAGPGQSIDKILTKQVTEKAPFLSVKMDEIFAQLRKGQIVTDVIPMLQNLFLPINQPYIMSWMKYDPTLEIAKLNLPILIINGTKDIQIEENEAKLLHRAHPKSKLVLIEGMNHIFKNIEKDEDNLRSYNNPKLPLHPDLIPTITDFLNTIP